MRIGVGEKIPAQRSQKTIYFSTSRHFPKKNNMSSRNLKKLIKRNHIITHDRSNTFLYLQFYCHNVILYFF